MRPSGFTEFQSTLSTILVSISIFYSTFKNAIILIAQSGDCITCDLATYTLMLQLSKYLYIYNTLYRAREIWTQSHYTLEGATHLPNCYISEQQHFLDRSLVVLACWLCVGGTGLLLVCWWYWLVAGVLVVLACWLCVGGTGLLVVCWWYWLVGCVLVVLACWLCVGGTGLLVVCWWYWLVGCVLVVLACCWCVGGTGLLVVCWWYWLVGCVLVVLACWLCVGGTGLLVVCW